MKRLFFYFLLFFYFPFCWAKSNYDLGLESVKHKNYEMAFNYFIKAAEQDNDEGAQHIIGNMYEFGKGVTQDKEKAAYWYQASAKQGNLISLCYLNIMHLKSEGIIKKDNEAFSWYQKEAEDGNVDAQLALGIIYYYGLSNLGVTDFPVSLEQAHYWYRKAAENGNADAQFALGSMYKYGQGVAKSSGQASYWYRKAAKQGSIMAHQESPGSPGSPYDEFDFTQFGLERLPEPRGCNEHGPEGDYEILSNIKLNNLNIKIFRNWNSHECKSGLRDHIHLDGAINPDSSFIVEKLLSEIQECHSGKGILPIQVYMSSKGGLIQDGFIIGNTFRKYGVKAIVLNEQQCASSCAIAFIGAKERVLKNGGDLLFHAPYEQKTQNNISCDNEAANIRLRAYLEKMLGKEAGKRIFDRTMSFCSDSQGWIINADAARIYGIVNS